MMDMHMVQKEWHGRL